MSTTDTASGGTPAPESQTSTQQTPPAPAPAAAPGLSLADVQRLLAEERQRIAADLEQKQAQREAALRAELEALRAAGGKGKGKQPPPKTEPPAEEVQAPAVIEPKPISEDPAWQALQSERQAEKAKLAEIEKALAAERGAREKAEESAREQERFKTLYDALIDLESPVRTDADGGQMAAKWILSQQKIQRSQKTGGYYVVEKDPATGEDKTTPVKEWVQGWLQTKEGARFRPALPAGAGTTPGIAPGSYQRPPSAPLTSVERIAAAREKDRLTRLGQQRN